MNTRTILQRAYPIMPVVEIDDARVALELADALVSAGITTVEITLRTAAALDAIEKLIGYSDKLLVGAGTVITIEQYRRVNELGVDFIISPGFSKKIADVIVKEKQHHWIPGVCSATEIMHAMEYGIEVFKLFPAEIAGGINALKAFKGPFQNACFCPTGGINKNNLASYLQMSNVECVGGSWIVPKEDIANKNWKHIAHLADEAVKICESID